MLQSMEDASPAKWHLAHTTWFFEEFILKPRDPGYRSPDERFAFLFNSYYVQAGPRHARDKRAMVSRPDGQAVAEYRAHVDDALGRLLETGRDDAERSPRWWSLAATTRCSTRSSRHRPVARLLLQPAPARLSRPRADAGDRGGAAVLHRARRRPRRDRPRRGRLRLRLRGSAPPDLARPVPHRGPAGDEPRVDRLHGGRRLRDRAALADGRLDLPRAGGLGRAALLVAAGRRVVDLHAPRGRSP
jgi:hypothetical protein